MVPRMGSSSLPLQRGDQIPNLGLENHPYLDSYLPAPRPKKSHPSRTSVKPVANETHPTLAVTETKLFRQRGRWSYLQSLSDHSAA